MNDHTKALIAAALEFARALIWPLFLGWVFYRFRSEFTALLARLGSMKVAGSEFVFQGSSAKSEKIVEETTPTDAPDLKPGPDGFLSPVTIRKVVDSSGLLEQGDRSVAELLLFQSPKQRSWMVATRKYIFLLLDDSSTRKGNRLIQTFFERTRVLPIQAQQSEGSPIVRFAAEDVWWFYSEQLFPNPRNLEDAVRKLRSA